MLSIQSKTTAESAVCPGVKFTVRRLNKIQRSARDLPVMEPRMRYTEISERYFELKGLKEPTPETEREARMIDYEAGLIINEHLKPASIRAALVSIEGLEIDGKPATADSLLADGSPDTDGLIDEIYAACEIASGLSGTQQKNLQSPSTSVEPADGETGGSTADPAVQ
jgi:hypothetical protein